MSPEEFEELRDALITWLFSYCPLLLQDEVLLEAFCFLIAREAARIARQERAKVLEQVREPAVN